MKQIFEFSGDEVSKLLFEELIKGEKIDKNKPYGLVLSVTASNGKLNLLLSVGDPIPGARSLD